MSSKNRKVYLMGDDSMADFFRTPTRYLKQSLDKESEFEKPYLEDDYRRMHFDFPTPDWPSMPDLPPWPPWPELPEFAPGAKWCFLWSPFGALDCDGTVTFPIGLCCVQEKGDPCIGTWKVWGDYTTVEQVRYSLEVGIDKEAGLQRPDKHAWIKACFTDACGNVCCEEETVLCKSCPPDVVMTWDTAAETIGQSATLGVSVKDGLGPYSWGVSGTGFSMLNVKTVGVSNVLQSDASACGTATITVTDSCDTVVTGHVRCTAGQWTEISFASCVISGAITEGDGETRIEGKWKLVEKWGTVCTSSTYGCCEATYGLCNIASLDCECNVSTGCHSVMGCTQCLDHGGICNVAGYSKECFCPSNCFCCAADGSDCNTQGDAARTMCNLETSKLYHWTCVP